MKFFGHGGVMDFNTYLLRGVLQNDTDWHKGGGGVLNSPKIKHVFFEWPLKHNRKTVLAWKII